MMQVPAAPVRGRKVDASRPGRASRALVPAATLGADEPQDAGEELVHRIAERHFGQRANKVIERVGGLTNTVHEFAVSQGDYIVRSHANATKIHDYQKERWAMDAARAAGLPTPVVLEVGNFEDGRPYMILEHVRGIEGQTAPARLPLLESLGRAAATLHRIATDGFGPTFNWSQNQLSRHKSWASWLNDGYCVERRLAVLKRHRLTDARSESRLRRAAEDMARWRKRPVLQHGDLRLKNTIVDTDTGRLAAIIDWENCTSLPAPYWDFSLALHDLGVDEKEAFLAGSGIKPRAFESAMPFIRFFTLLNYAGAVELAAEKQDRACLERFRIRFRGSLDLFQG